MADIYKRQGKLGRWKEVLEDSLESEDFALSHARTRVTIAEFHMERGELDQALPYAVAAADTGAAWAMLCASRCLEGLGRWEESEAMVRATSERYDEQPFVWYFWCRRTGHGDLAAAQDFALDQAKRLARGKRPGNQNILGVVYQLMGDQQCALEEFGPGAARGDAYCLIYIALIAHERGDAAARDAALADAVERGAAYEKSIGRSDLSMFEIARWMQAAVKQPVGEEPPITALEKILKPQTPEGICHSCYIVGRYFELSGNEKLAHAYYQRGLDTHAYQKSPYTLSGLRLREMNEAGK